MIDIINLINSEKIKLNNGNYMPKLGYGVYKIENKNVVNLVYFAIQNGYLGIDTASYYNNEKGVGLAINMILKNRQIKRNEIFITTKVWNNDHGYLKTLKAFNRSLKNLQLDYIDLYLIHWPCPINNKYIETYKALEYLYKNGLVKNIGVSNFQKEHLKCIMHNCEIIPCVNQIEFHPLFRECNLLNFHKKHGIITQSWSPLSRGLILSNKHIKNIAKQYDVSPAQIVLRWQLQHGNSVIPKSSTKKRILENKKIFHFFLNKNQMRIINNLNLGNRIGPNPSKLK